ncbi:MAG: hypothetical protein AB8G86_21425 [Saprospiraceae bacterium]
MELKDTINPVTVAEQPDVAVQPDITGPPSIIEQPDIAEQFFTNISWWEFLLVALALAAIYFVLFEIQQLTKHSSFSGRYQNQFRELFRKTFVVFELLAIVTLAGVFVWINPWLHGSIMLFLVIGSWAYLKSYISGRWIHFDNDIVEGIKIQADNLDGIVAKMGRVKMHLQTSDGLHHLSYNQLLDRGYTLVSGEKIGGFYHLALTPKEDTATFSNHRMHLLDLFATAPYVDWHHKPELFQDEAVENQIDAKVLIKEESHLHELIALIKEWGYHCKLVNV